MSSHKMNDVKGLNMDTLAYLASVSQRLAVDEPMVSRHAGREMYRHAKRHGIVLHDEFKERYCQQCCSSIIPTITTTSITVHSKKNGVYVEYKCGICNGITRINNGIIEPEVIDMAPSQSSTIMEENNKEKLIIKVPKATPANPKGKNRKKNKNSLMNVGRTSQPSSLNKAREALRGGSIVHLSQDKISLAIIYNFALASLLLVNKILLQIFVGHLRDLEVEQLIDSGRGFVADTILFLVFYSPTINDREVGTVQLMKYVCLAICLKVFHLVAQIRVGHIFELGFTSLSSLLRLAALIFMSGTLDIIGISTFYGLSSSRSSFYTWCLFEAITMGLTALTTLTKFIIHLIDMRLEHGWTSKTQLLFHVDLWGDVGQMTTYLCFMMVFLSQNPTRLPFYAIADILQIAKQLITRLYSLRKYRAITANMEERFPDATKEELEQQDTCIICRDKLWEGSKKLPCGHVFHIDCLKSWLVMQQVCPTCRAEIPTNMPPRNAAADAAQARQQQQAARGGGDQQQHQQQQTREKEEGNANTEGGKSESSRDGKVDTNNSSSSSTATTAATAASKDKTAKGEEGKGAEKNILPASKTVELPGGGTVTMTHLPIIPPKVEGSNDNNTTTSLLTALGVETAEELRQAIKHAIKMVEYYDNEKKYWRGLIGDEGDDNNKNGRSSSSTAAAAAAGIPEAVVKIVKEEEKAVVKEEEEEQKENASVEETSVRMSSADTHINLNVPLIPDRKQSDEGTQTPRLGIQSDRLEPAPKDEFELIRRQRQLRYKMQKQTSSRCDVTEERSDEEDKEESE
ncbi:E3 ubiquitin-protein ligase hrd1 [Perkinsus chesapeaki]|uniref:RING-type E3 ubiquitin transferase n=1 Tax=Perkinsus chesapeaki TaxID=330153 RepID=A0A7J6N1A1_PERCH|nr:E3 ubiquitin-protein ligase hrd1 [Perkinsus chesapeaki]